MTPCSDRCPMEIPIRPDLIVCHGPTRHVVDLLAVLDSLEFSELAEVLGKCVERLKAYSTLAHELEDEKAYRAALSTMHRKAQRENNRTQLDLWFWRPEKGLDVEEMLLRRARYLIQEMRYVNNDVWDLLSEFVEDWLESEVDGDLMKRVIRRAISEGRAA